jgi:hypothetical protein
LSVTVVYFVAGVAVQKFVFKKEGVEMVPNSAFWLVLPGLIKVLYALILGMMYTTGSCSWHSCDMECRMGTSSRTRACGVCLAAATSRSSLDEASSQA